METCLPLLMANVLFLGFRHGFDWDHMAALLDIVSTTQRKSGSPTAKWIEKSSVGLATLYALGHALVCLILGLAAIFFHMLAPDWLDNIMEKVVGATLIFLGVWIFISLRQENFVPRSGWMLALNAMRVAWQKLRERLGASPKVITPWENYGAKTAFGIGMIHGIGAETATQVLMITTICGATSKAGGVALLITFLCGLITSNLLVSLLASGGFLASAQVRRLQLGAAMLAGSFSVVLGSIYCFGAAEHLPELQKLIGLGQASIGAIHTAM